MHEQSPASQQQSWKQSLAQMDQEAEEKEEEPNQDAQTALQ